MKSTRAKLYCFVVIFTLFSLIVSTAPSAARGETILKAPLSPTHSSRGLSQVVPARGCKWKGCSSLAQGWTGSEGFGGGNPSGNPSGEPGQRSRGQSVNTLSGNFYHTFTDFSIAGRGLPLLFSRTYNAGAASQDGPLGSGWTDSYNLSLTIQQGSVTVNQENGSTVTFTLSGGVYTAPPKVLATLVQHQDGSFTFTRIQGQTYYTFNASGQLTQETDRDGYLTTLSYQGGHLSSVTDQAGRSLSFTWTGNTISAVTDPIGRKVSFQYDQNGNLTAVIDVNGGTTSFSYDTNHLLLHMTDPNGGVVSNVYDTSSPPRVTSQTDAMGRTTTFSYGPNTTTTITDPNGNVSIDQYQNALLVAQTMGFGTPQAATSSYTYDPTLGIATMTDPNGHVWSNTFDGQGNQLSATDPLGRTTKYTYDTFNAVTSITDPLGEKTTLKYNAQGNLVSTSRPLKGTKQKQTTIYTYGDSQHPGDVTAMADADGKVSTYAYDQDGNQVSATDPLGDKTTYQYNGIGWKTAAVSPKGNTTSYTYDQFGNVASVTDPLAHITTYGYDKNQNLVTTTDANGNTTAYVYDLDNELVSVKRADGSVLSYGYDNNGNQTGYTDGLGSGHTTTYSYDPLNRVSSLADPLGRTTSYSYDLAGNRISLKDPAGNVTSYSYDTANEQTGISYSDGKTPTVSFTYDADGQRTSMSDGTGTTSSTYDSLNRLTQTTNGAKSRVGYGYDLKGQLTSLTYPNGMLVKRTYDAAGRLTAVKDWLGHSSTFSYDSDSNIVGQSYANSVQGVFQYDQNDQLTSIVDKQGNNTLLSFTYTRDNLEQLASLQTQGTPQGNENYSYTSLNQVSAVNNQTYKYDAGDNLTNSGSATLRYDAANEVMSLVNGSGITTFSYDARGNRVQQIAPKNNVTSYSYDQASRLTAYSTGLTKAQYTYNGDGLRMSKAVSGSAEAFTWDVAEGTPMLLQDGKTQYVYGPDGLPLEQLTGKTVLYYHEDQLGSTRALTNSTGVVVATYAYDAYGNVTGKTGKVSNPFQYAGQYSDAESGLIYMQARYYDPSTQQFLTRDPLVSQTHQAYGYVDGNPLNMTDPTGSWGHWKWIWKQVWHWSWIIGLWFVWVLVCIFVLW